MRDRDMELMEGLTALGQAVDVLDDRSRQVLSRYFFDDMTQSDITAGFDVSQMQVSRWVRSALDRLRSHLVAG